MTRKIEFLRFVSVVGPKVQPYSARDENGSDTYVYDAKLIRAIADYFGARYEILTPPDGAYGSRLPDGNWTGMVEMVRREGADLAMAGITVTSERFEAVRFTFPHLHSTLTFMTDAPLPMPKNLAIFRPFSPTLWAALAGLTVAMSLLFYVLLGRSRPYQGVLLDTIGSTLENALDFKTGRRPVKTAAFFWVLGTFLVANSYKAVLLSFLTFPTMVGVRDILDLSRAASADPSFKCITFPGSYIFKSFVESDDPSWKAIGECLVRSRMPGDSLGNFLSSPRGKAWVGRKLNTVPFESHYFVSEDNFYIEFYGIAYSKTFCCPEALNGMLHRFFAAGILEKFLREENFFTVLKTPELTSPYAEVSSVVSLGDLSGVFYILMSGWIAGFVTLLIEMVVQKYN